MFDEIDASVDADSSFWSGVTLKSIFAFAMF